MFKEGDEIECLDNYEDQFTEGSIYVVVQDQSGTFVVVEEDDTGEVNGWDAKNFALVKAAQGKTHLPSFLWDKKEQSV